VARGSRNQRQPEPIEAQLDSTRSCNRRGGTGNRKGRKRLKSVCLPSSKARQIKPKQKFSKDDSQQPRQANANNFDSVQRCVRHRADASNFSAYDNGIKR
jgi:hypothetical protein